MMDGALPHVDLVQKGFRILHPLLAGYVAMELSKAYMESWWKDGVLQVLSDKGRDLPTQGSYKELVDSLDMANCLRLIDWNWGAVFRTRIPVDNRTWAKELMGIRNRVAHIGGEDFSEDDAWRALDTMARLCHTFDEEGEAEIRKLQRVLRYGSEKGSLASKTVKVPETEIAVHQSSGFPVENLPSWRQVMQPHPDVCEGRYTTAEFAANLSDVARGKAAFEYQDPVEFFQRTYVTAGMKGLLVQALERVTGKGGDPVIQLKTAFGGGKTHSMLALYHLMRSSRQLVEVPQVAGILKQVGVESCPEVHVAVLVGTELDPATTRRPADFPGISISTLWGELAAQLSRSIGEPKLYDLIKEADKKGVSPGSEKLRQLFDACGSCVVLMDELVAYARKLYGQQNLPAGTFENLLSFIQEITEAAKSSKSSLVVASIPESDIEIGGEAGQKALRAIEHTFGRVESIWKPVAASEGFEVVRRRLFQNCNDKVAREDICEAFSRMYQKNPRDFPIDAREADYKRRMLSCYPIHPEIFDDLYDKWSTLKNFQRTRGVLRFMAGIIHALWMDNDGSPMIMPGSLPMSTPKVRDELSRYLENEQAWNGIIDSEVDGKNSISVKLEKGNPRYADGMLCRRLTRTIFLGSAPVDKSQTVRGIDYNHIHLGSILPGDNIAGFNDALNTLRNELSYLYVNGNYFYYDTRPTLQKMVRDRANQKQDVEADEEIMRRLGKVRREAPFARIHLFRSAQDVSDEQNLGLVILHPSDTYRKGGDEDSRGIAIAKLILEKKGDMPRNYKNMLIFLAPDLDGMKNLREEVKKYLAWQSIQKDSAGDSPILDLQKTQLKSVKEELDRSDMAVDRKLKETYKWVLVPDMDPNSSIQWQTYEAVSGDRSLLAGVVAQLRESESVISTWGPLLLKRLLEKWIWKEDRNYIEIGQLWKYMCTYCYMDRLAGYEVLQSTIRKGVENGECFGYAEGFSSNCFIGLKNKTVILDVDSKGYLVRVEDAWKQQAEEPKVESTMQPIFGTGTTDPTGTEGYNPDLSGGNGNSGVSETPIVTNFYLKKDLDRVRVVRDVQQIVTEIVNNLTEEPGSHVKLTLEVQATFDTGLEEDAVKAVEENCKTLKITNYEFD